MDMAALRSRLVLHRRGSRVTTEETNLDHKDPTVLRSHLERMVLAARGTLHLDLSDYWLDVRTTGGTQRCETRVSPSGATTVRRLAAY